MSRVWLALILAAQASGVCAAADSLCLTGEQAVFSCPVGRKLVSLCASPDLTPTTGTLHYRFGRKGAVELDYPRQAGHPRQFFSASVLSYSDGGGDYLRFSSGEFEYVIYSALGRGWEKEGVVVTRKGEQLASLVCRGAALGPEGWARVYKAQLPRATADFELP